MAKRKKIALIFATGTVLSSLKSQSIVFVDSDTDIPKWMESIPEISLIADIEPHFFMSESEVLGYNDTLRLSELINNLKGQADGIVILIRTECIIQQATLLDFLNQNIAVPIIITGAVVSPQALAEGALSDLFKKSVALSLKSNLINAIQVATRDFHGFGIMYGNRLIDPLRASRDNIETLNAFSSVDGKYAGRVEFGISLNNAKKAARPAKHYVKFSTNIEIIDSALLTADSLKHLKSEALIVKMRENERLPFELYEALRSLKQPVILYNYWYVMEHRGLPTISGITEEALRSKVMWLSAEYKNKETFLKVLTDNVMGEFIK